MIPDDSELLFELTPNDFSEDNLGKITAPLLKIKNPCLLWLFVVAIVTPPRDLLG